MHEQLIFMQIHLTEATICERVNIQQCYTMSLSIYQGMWCSMNESWGRWHYTNIISNPKAENLEAIISVKIIWFTLQCVKIQFICFH